MIIFVDIATYIIMKLFIRAIYLLGYFFTFILWLLQQAFRHPVVGLPTLGAVGVLAVLGVIGGSGQPNTASPAASEQAPSVVPTALPLSTIPAGPPTAAAAAAAAKTTPSTKASPSSLHTATQPALNDLTTVTIPTTGTVFYEADWPSGLGGRLLSPAWKIVNGILVNDGSQEGSVSLAPYSPTVADYAVEANIQLVSGDSSYYLVLRWDQLDGYLAGLGGNAAKIWATRRGPSPIAQRSFQADKQWHSYRAEVRGNQIRYLTDGQVVLEAVDNSRLLAGQTGIYVNNKQINVRSFRVIAL